MSNRIEQRGRAVPLTGETSEPTYWNGEPCKARIVRVIVGSSPRDTWWCAKLAGTEREAVEVVYEGMTFYLDNDAHDGTIEVFGQTLMSVHAKGDGWRKVTIGLGSPDWGHGSLPVARVLP